MHTLSSVLDRAASDSINGGSRSSALPWLPAFPDLSILHDQTKGPAEGGLFYTDFPRPRSHRFKRVDWGRGLEIMLSDTFRRRLLEPINKINSHQQ